MKLSDFFVTMFGSSNSKQEFDQLKKWRDEVKVNASSLDGNSKKSGDSFSDLSVYKSFDVESALQQSLLEIQKERSGGKLKYLIGAFAILILLALGIHFNNNKTSATETIIYTASQETEAFKRIDGTILTLENNTVLKDFSDQNKMSLNGKAFFDVVKQDQPLIIETAAGKIKVIGTSFDVYTTTNLTEIYMYEGVIQFETVDNEKYEVSEGQTLKSYNGKTSIENSFNSQLSAFWRTGELKYNNVNLTNVLDDISRLYDKEIFVEGNMDRLPNISTSFKNAELSDIIQELAVITGIELTIN